MPWRSKLSCWELVLSSQWLTGIRYMSGSRIGEELFDTPALQALWLETSRHIVA